MKFLDWLASFPWRYPNLPLWIALTALLVAAAEVILILLAAR